MVVEDSERAVVVLGWVVKGLMEVAVDQGKLAEG